ncbi:2'-5' RNA ligase family protein [Actinomadura sp. NPDC047616]|uniref:2'-5' RNA ligase family protein n=1 Tax=Actinomadura sp. NPDC047616 TaxID=3155914 RepID=UPI0033E65E62
MLVWHILVDDQPAVCELARQCQQRLAALDGLDFVPRQWLHMTTQIVGFTDEIPDAEIEAMADAAAEGLRRVDPIEVEIGKIWFHSEAVMLGIRPPRALDPVRSAIREAVARSVTIHQLADEPDWTPHISIAYSNSDGPAAPVIEALVPRPAMQPLKVAEVHLVAQERAGRLYRWDRLKVVHLGA